jgi:uncharacterized membrane protein YoaK (UPF0700 family)
LALTTVTGLVDAVSILQLGLAFVANMTGNLGFTGFPIAARRAFPQCLAIRPGRDLRPPRANRIREA